MAVSELYTKKSLINFNGCKETTTSRVATTEKLLYNEAEAKGKPPYYFPKIITMTDHNEVNAPSPRQTLNGQVC